MAGKLAGIEDHLATYDDGATVRIPATVRVEHCGAEAPGCWKLCRLGHASGLPHGYLVQRGGRPEALLIVLDRLARA